MFRKIISTEITKLAASISRNPSTIFGKSNIRFCTNQARHSALLKTLSNMTEDKRLNAALNENIAEFGCAEIPFLQGEAYRAAGEFKTAILFYEEAMKDKNYKDKSQNEIREIELILEKKHTLRR